MTHWRPTFSCFIRSITYAVLLASVVLVCSPARGQAHATATRSAELFAYGGFVYSQPDWGLAGTNDKGMFGGAAYIRYVTLLHRELGLGLDVRYDRDTGPTVNENAFTGNLQIRKNFGRFHPYGTVGYGFGTIHFHYLPDPSLPTYTFDNGPILAGGLGLDYDVYRHFSVKADYQFQAWHLGLHDEIGPSVFSFGVSYRIPMHAWISHGHERN